MLAPVHPTGYRPGTTAAASWNAPERATCIVSVVSRRFRRFAIAAAVLPLVVLVGLQSAWAAFACRVDGEVRDACCCPKKSADHRDDAPHIIAPCCCDVTIHDRADGPDARQAERSDPLAIPAFVAPSVLTTPARPAFGVLANTRFAFARPPPPSVPAFLANRSILR